jgi:hypothetical protein
MPLDIRCPRPLRPDGFWPPSARAFFRRRALRENIREQIPRIFPQFAGGERGLFTFKDWGNGSAWW